MEFDPSKNEDHKIPNNEYFNFKVGTGNGDFLKLFQDPTTLGFKLFFINIIDSANIVNDDFVDTSTVINSTGLFGNETNENSALYYLKSMGDNARFNMLKDFKSLLSTLNIDYPWYFQSIEGLSEAWVRDYKTPKIKKELTITCLESIDLRITALMDLYRKIAYDWNNRRAILPDNLRKFNLSIKIYDIRNIEKNPGKYISYDDRNKAKYFFNSDFLGDDYSVSTQISFNLSHCEFLPDDSGNIFNSVSNSSYENATQSIKISYENIEEDNIYRSLVALGNNPHYYVRDFLTQELELINNSKELNAFPQSDKLSDRKSSLLKNKLGGVFDDIKKNVSAEALNIVKSKVSSLYLGNVYGFSPSTTVGTGRDTITRAPSRALGNLF